MMILNIKISDSLFRTYVVIKSFGYGKNKSFPSQERVAKELGKRRETINRHVMELEKLRFIKKKKRGYSMSNEYEFCEENITNDKKLTNESDLNTTSIVTKSSPQLSQNNHTNNTSNKTNNNIEIIKGEIRKKYSFLRVKQNA